MASWHRPLARGEWCRTLPLRGGRCGDGTALIPEATQFSGIELLPSPKGLQCPGLGFVPHLYLMKYYSKISDTETRLLLFLLKGDDYEGFTPAVNSEELSQQWQHPFLWSWHLSLMAEQLAGTFCISGWSRLKSFFTWNPGGEYQVWDGMMSARTDI